MRNKKRNRVHVALTGLVVAIVLVAWAAPQLRDRCLYQQYERALQERQEVFQDGETIALTSDGKEPEAIGAWPLGADLPWTGTLEITVHNAKLYDTANAAGCAEVDLMYDGYEEESDYDFLLCEVTFANVDATPLADGVSAREGKFDTAFMTPLHASELTFMAPAEDGEPLRESAFSLGIGERRAYLMGWAVIAGEACDTVSFGANQLYTVQLAVADERSGA